MGNYASTTKSGAQGVAIGNDGVPVQDGESPSRANKRPFEASEGAHISSNMGSVDGTAVVTADGDIENVDVVPTVFKWEHGGRNVYITGTFNNWDRRIPMHRSGNDFSYVHNLKRGKHAFKFIVDDEWRFAPDQPTVADVEGRVSNFIDVSDFQVRTCRPPCARRPAVRACLWLCA